MSEHFIYRTPQDERMFEHSYFKPEEAHKRAKGVLDEYEVRLDPFVGLYGEEILQRDAERIERIEKNFEHSPSKLHADVLEAIICEHGELSNWFGPNSAVIKTGKFDDYVNKIDLVVETKEENQFSHLALGVDVTFGSRDLHTKFDRIKENIDDGSLGEVKYFHSDRQHFTGRLAKIPQVVIGVELEQVKEIGLLWMNRRNKDLAIHPVQVTLLKEAALQLKTFAAYAAKTGKAELVPFFERELQKIAEILEAKRAVNLKGISHDKVFEEIQRNLATFA